MPIQSDLTLVIDIGKSNAKLLMLDDAGRLVEQHARTNASVVSPLGYPALDVHGLESWMAQTLLTSGNRGRCGRVIASTHGAAMVAVDSVGLAWEPIDYEFDVLGRHPDLAKAFEIEIDKFSKTLSPDLPAGLNAARQFFYIQRLYPQVWQRTRTLLPYAQYWAWRLCGQIASEVSSLGCHTHLWYPKSAEFSDLACSNGWASLFAPVRSAWDVLGCVTPPICTSWGLPARCRVHVGVHDSNACLARYLNAAGTGTPTPEAITVVSSGTWTVLMAPGAPTTALQAQHDMLANVDVIGRATPTARFMGGREYSVLLDGADPDEGSYTDLQALVDAQIFAYPAFSEQGGPFAGRSGSVFKAGVPVPMPAATNLNPSQRAALAALYCALMTRWLVDSLWVGAVNAHKVIVEGPLAHNNLFLCALKALLPAARCCVNTDGVEGTAKGAWCLAHWAERLPAVDLQTVNASALQGLGDYYRQWATALR